MPLPQTLHTHAEFTEAIVKRFYRCWGTAHTGTIDLIAPNAVSATGVDLSLLSVGQNITLLDGFGASRYRQLVIASIDTSSDPHTLTVEVPPERVTTELSSSQVFASDVAATGSERLIGVKTPWAVQYATGGLQWYAGSLPHNAPFLVVDLGQAEVSKRHQTVGNGQWNYRHDGVMRLKLFTPNSSQYARQKDFIGLSDWVAGCVNNVCDDGVYTLDGGIQRAIPMPDHNGFDGIYMDVKYWWIRWGIDFDG